jgi:hypothetical protein
MNYLRRGKPLLIAGPTRRFLALRRAAIAQTQKRVSCLPAGQLRSSPQAGPIRLCRQGKLCLASSYRRRALVSGPLALGDLRAYTGEQPLPGTLDGRHGAFEVIAIVNASTDPVLSLPRSEWSTVGLLYDPNKFRSDGAYRIQDLDQVVRFRACRSPSFNHGVSQFDGGFVVTRKQCVHFLVMVPGGRTYHGEFPAAALCERAR